MLLSCCTLINGKDSLIPLINFKKLVHLKQDQCDVTWLWEPQTTFGKSWIVVIRMPQAVHFLPEKLLYRTYKYTELQEMKLFGMYYSALAYTKVLE